MARLRLASTTDTLAREAERNHANRSTCSDPENIVQHRCVLADNVATASSEDC
jgi:hypothetical protein